MSNNTLLLLALLLALLDWYAVVSDHKPLEYIVKPGVMVALLAWLWTQTGFQGHVFWFALGLFFSLWGDIFLMLPRDGFIPSLVSFLLAHISYAIGFTRTLPVANLASLMMALAVTAAAGFVYRRVRDGLIASENRKLVTPVFIYTNMISLMLLTALLTLLRPDWSLEAAILACLGAILFFISDGILAWRMFVAPLRWGRLLGITSYHIGQALIALGVILQYSNIA